MALPDSNQPLPRVGAPPKPITPRPITPRPTAPKPQSVPPPEDTSIFGGRQYVPISEIKNRWRGPSRQIPGTGRLLSEKDRFVLTERLGKNYGSYINKGNVSRELSKLEREKSGKSPQERERIDDQIRWLKGELGPGK
jgi:hypothetical protein